MHVECMCVDALNNMSTCRSVQISLVEINTEIELHCMPDALIRKLLSKLRIESSYNFKNDSLSNEVPRHGIIAITLFHTPKACPVNPSPPTSFSNSYIATVMAEARVV